MLQLWANGFRSGGFPEFFQGFGLDLSNPLLRHAQGRTDFLERLRLSLMIEAVAADDNCLLPRVEPVEELPYLLHPVALGEALLRLVGAAVSGALEQVHIDSTEAVATPMFIGNRTGIIAHEAYVLNLLPRE